MSQKQIKRNVRLSRAKNRVRGAVDKFGVFSELRHELDLSSLQLLAKWSYAWLPSLGILGKLTPKRLSDLNAVNPLRSIGLRRDVEWITATVKREAQNINQYLQLKASLEASLLGGSLDLSVQILGQMDEALGFSLHVLSTRIALEQVSKGLEAQKELISELRSKNIAPMPLFYCFWFSVRAEDGSTAEHFSRDIRRRLQTWELDPEVRAQLHYYLLNEYPPVGDENLLLASGTSGSIVDTYEMFIGAATIAVSEQRSTSHHFHEGIAQLAEAIDDARLNKLLFLFGKCRTLEISHLGISNREALLSGNTGDEKSDLFEPAPYQHTLSSSLRGAIERLAEDQDFLESIWKAFPAKKPMGRPSVHVGPFASGAAVVANKALFATIQAQQHRKLLGLDMEAYGVVSAARELPFPQPDCFVLKGVSDFADIDKGDKIRHYAAYVSARAITAICERLE
ncbi:hypothetical protein [Asticcacaulis sp.]|uniref:hypothetical protein n=1 Tax=Asticcacaulis sp. TaxID=1872648 RepID=UPI002BC5339E|nr:hypothetical protein [Asticcacaulis sp.]HTM81612.1 hypothetical protein [Asticcacaulis sp.]